MDLPSVEFCLRKSAGLLLHEPDRAEEAQAWAALASAVGSTMAETAAQRVATAAIQFFTQAGADSFNALQQAVKEYEDVRYRT